MFQSARLKLTAWYLLIIMVISVIFSLTLYRVVDGELQRYIHRLEHQRQDPFDILPLRPTPLVTIEELQESEQRLAFILLGINTGILLLSGAAGYFLAGRTLRPIQEMVDEQNRFITDASHELRTPITALRSEIEVSLRDKHLTSSDARKLLESNLEEVNNLQSLSEKLIQLVQHSPNADIAMMQEASLLAMLEHVQKKLSALAKQKNITITISSKDYPIHADKQTLEQCFTIFVDNAIKYSPEYTEIHISTEKSDHAVFIHITDQGVGIARKDLPHIFDRFYRADASRTKQQVSGYGLGLSIAKKIIDSYHGSVNVKSEPGKGTTFTIQLPMR